MDWSFGTFLWSMALFFFWFMVIWMFIALFADILRRTMSGWAKAGWIALLVVLPFLGALIYLIARPRDIDVPSPMGRWDGAAGYRPQRAATDEIARAARLYDEGKLSDAEFDQLKRKALQY